MLFVRLYDEKGRASLALYLRSKGDAMRKGTAKQGLMAIGLAVSGIFVTIALSVVPSHAASVTFSFKGSVSDVIGGVFTSGGTGSNGFSSSLPLSGSFTFNSATPDLMPSNNWGLYVNSIQNMTLKIGNYTASLPPGNSVIQVFNNPGLADRFLLTLDGFSGNKVNGLTPTSFELELTNPSGNVFSNDHLPTGPPSLSSFASNQWRLVFSGIGNRVQGALTSLVPLPAAVWLFGAGLIALVGLGSRGLVTRKES